VRDYKNIKAYNLADNLVIEIYKMTKRFPKEELYGLVSQLQRAAVSIPANIAEGASRQHKRDYLNYLYNARGSLSETEYLLHLSNELNYLTGEEYSNIEKLRVETSKALYGLITAVAKEL